MRAHGTDRLRQDEGGRILLDCQREKPGWKPRVPKTLTRSEHPGTAIWFEEQHFEVVDVQPLPHGIRYVLEPWRDEHAIRVQQVYDAPTEAARIAEHRNAVARERNRIRVSLLGVVIGHAPAVVQERLGEELGIYPWRLTTVSCFGMFVPIIICVQVATKATIANEVSQVSFTIWILSVALALESLFRLSIALFQMRPVGSLFGCIAYILLYYVVPKRQNFVSPFANERGTSTPLNLMPPEEEIALRDALSMREPFVTLLTPEEQERLTARFGYDHRDLAYHTAWVILGIAATGAVTSLATMYTRTSATALLSFVCASWIVLEQIVRLRSFAKGPAGSVLGLLVRPFVRKLFV